MKLILLGAPGAGKGTQAAKLSEAYSIPAISTGHIIRVAIAEKTPVGVEAKGYIDRGELVPDDMVVKMVQERLKQDDCKNGYILDGFPRTVQQAKIMEQLPIPIDYAVEIHVSTEIIVDRLSGRRECGACGATYHVTDHPPKAAGVCDVCGGALTRRQDDVPEIIQHRIAVYNEQTAPLIDFYRNKGNLITVIGQNTVPGTTELLLEKITEKQKEAGL